MSNFKIFVVEDDPWYRKIINHYLTLNPDYEVHLFATGKELLENLYQKPDLICMDFNLPDTKGDRLLQDVLLKYKQIPVIVISSQEDISVAVELLKLGASDYIVKDEHAKELLWKSIMQIRENLSLRLEVEHLKDQLGQKYSFQNTIIGQSSALQQTLSMVQKAVQSGINVSLTGETGTGKEVVAKAIHFNSERSRKPFVAVNMSAIPRELVESELFGYEKGAFTGASSTKIGKFEEAHGGTLFLDEIAEMDLSLQSKILRAVQEREITRVGGNKTIRIDIRLITATHKNLSEEVKQGRFREDLFFRIVGMPIFLPPLRERDNDVIILAKHFIQDYAKTNSQKAKILSENARLKLKSYHWPGNVRELKAVIDLACVMAGNDEINDSDITFYELGGFRAYDEGDKSLKEYEIEIINAYMRKYNNNVKLVADKLSIAKSKLYNMLKSGELIMY